MKKPSESVFPAEIDPLIFYEDADIEHQPLLHAYYQYIINNRFQEAAEYINNTDLDFYGAWLLNLYENRLRAIEENIEMVIGAKCQITTYYENEPTSIISMDCRSWVGGNEYTDNFYLYRLGVVNGDSSFTLTEAAAKAYMNVDSLSEVTPIIDISYDENRLIGTSGTGNLQTYDHYIFEQITCRLADGTNWGYITNDTAPSWCPKVFLTQEFSDGLGRDQIAIPYTLYYLKGNIEETNKIKNIGSLARRVTYNSMKYGKDADKWYRIDGTIDVSAIDDNYTNYTEKNFLISLPYEQTKIDLGQEYHYQTTGWAICSCRATLIVQKTYDNSTGILSVSCYFSCVPRDGDNFTAAFRSIGVYLVQLNSIISDDIPSSIVVSPSELVVNTIGASTQLFSTVYNQFGEPMNNQPVSYSSSDTTIATVTSGGKVTTKKRGNVVITATCGNLSATSNIQVGANPIPTTISVAPMSILIDTVNGTEQIVASVKDQYGEDIPDATITYTSFIPATASVSSSGLVTGLKNGTANINVACGNISTTVPVTVSFYADHIIVTPSSVNMTIGQTGISLTAVAYDRNDTPIQNINYVWASSDSTKVTVNNGNISAIADGTVTITATYQNTTGSSTIVVKQPVTPTTLNITPTSKTFKKVAERQQLAIEVLDQYGDPISNPTLNIYSTNTSIATVTSAGWITPVNNGNCSIVVECNNLRATCSVVVDFLATSMEVNPSTATITQLNGTVQLTPVFKDADGAVVPSETCTWESNNTSIATVSSSGLVTGLSNGTARIQAINSRRTMSAFATITVSIDMTPRPTSMVVSPTSMTFASSTTTDTQTITTTVYDQFNNVINNPNVTYTSSNTNIVTVNSNGVVSVNGTSGNTTITVTCATLSETVNITVRGPVPTSMTVPDSEYTFYDEGFTYSILPTVYDQYGGVIDRENLDITYTSSNSNVASVVKMSDSTNKNYGKVTSVSSGTAVITVTCGSLATTVSIIVRGLEIVSWADGTNDQIKTMIIQADKGKIDLTNYWHVGDERRITLPAVQSSYSSLEEQPSQSVTLVLAAADTKVNSSSNPCYNYSYRASEIPTYVTRRYPSFIVMFKWTMDERGILGHGTTSLEGFSATIRHDWLRLGNNNKNLPFSIASAFEDKWFNGYVMKVAHFKGATDYTGTDMSTPFTYLFFPAVTEIYGKSVTETTDGSSIPNNEINELCQWPIFANGFIPGGYDFWTRTPVKQYRKFATSYLSMYSKPLIEDCTHTSGILPCFCI